MIEKLKNGPPHMKFLALFLLAPKGAFIFGPILIKKALTKYGISSMVVGMYASKIGLGVAVWFAIKTIMKNNQFIQDQLMKVSNFGVLVDETESRRRDACQTSNTYIKNALSTCIELSLVFGTCYLTEQAFLATELGLTLKYMLKEQIINFLSFAFGYESGMSMGLLATKIAGTMVIAGAALMRIPQIVRIMKEKSAKGLSPQMFYQDVSDSDSKNKPATAS